MYQVITEYFDTRAGPPYRQTFDNEVDAQKCYTRELTYMRGGIKRVRLLRDGVTVQMAS